ncbi:spore germination protein [Bacillus ectoiniformans]|uniref:germination protein YpeB n=1 Tax=Bacillus ectoiniformans TaxID=1494429 RepID=UPI001955FA07|nr:germination protein YpeB [Bacillus ectoiniformans]MBM7648010.1 spore germination protein [Bacillus ectoiniformans]
MLRIFTIIILSLAAAGTGVWGYQEHREKNAILINAENNYQRAFHDLTFQVDRIHDQIGATLAMNSRKSLSPALADVWRLTSEAHSDVGQLPLTLLPFNKTEDFLGEMGDFSYRTAVRDLEKEPLSDQEYNHLKNLHKQSAQIKEELRKVQHLVIKNNLRWMDVELALATGKENSDNTIIDGFKTVEKQAEGYSETNASTVPGQTDALKDNRLKKLPGDKVSKEQAVEIAKEYSQMKQPEEVKVTKSGKGSDFPFYSVNMKGKSGNEVSMDITQKGGYPVWYILNREVQKPKIGLNDAFIKAESFLKKNKYEGLELFDSAQYDSVGVFTFVAVQDGVRIYPDAVKIKVALDNGQVIGAAAKDYLEHDQKRTFGKPVLSETEAEAYINKNVKVQEKRLAVIKNELNKEVLCYEFLGTLGKDTYRILINAKDGTEEQVEVLKQAEPVYEDVL